MATLLSTRNYEVSDAEFRHAETFVHKDPNSGCWLWSGAGSRAGYGVFTPYRNRVPFPLLAHRMFYTKLVGPVSRELVMDHKCRVKRCCNPDHLRPVTPRVNALENSVGVAAVNAAKTKCPLGHAYVSRASGRVCPVCSDEAAQLYREKARALSPKNWNTTKTHCINGHELNDANTYTATDRAGFKHRHCRACRAADARAFRRRHKA